MKDYVYIIVLMMVVKVNGNTVKMQGSSTCCLFLNTYRRDGVGRLEYVTLWRLSVYRSGRMSRWSVPRAERTVSLYLGIYRL